IDAAAFDPVGINYLLHCLPGTIESKAVSFDHLKALMNPGALFFGSTLLQGGVTQSWPAKRLMDFYNRKGYLRTRMMTLTVCTGLRASGFDRFQLKLWAAQRCFPDGRKHCHWEVASRNA